MKGDSRKKKSIKLNKVRMYGIGFVALLTIINFMLLIPVTRELKYRIDMRDNQYWLSDYKTQAWYESYEIKSGDTLTSIANDLWNQNPDLYSYKYRDLESLIQDICDMNRLKNADSIHYGCYLVVPILK